MKDLKLFLDSEIEEDLDIGLIRLIKPQPDHEFFYKINSAGDTKFSRIQDLVLSGNYYDYHFSRFEGYDSETGLCVQFISNKSIFNNKKKEITELFSDETELKHLLPGFQDVDYIVKTSDGIANFSLLLNPENIMFQIQSFQLSSDTELYQLIQYYE